MPSLAWLLQLGSRMTAKQIKAEAKALQKKLDRGESPEGHERMRELCDEYEATTGEWLWL